MTRRSPARRWTLRDLLLATALLALGCAWVRCAMDALQESRVGGAAFDRYPYDSVIWEYGGAFGLVAAMAVLVFFRLRRPRPSLRRLVRQPGLMACAAVALNLTIDLAWVTRAEFCLGSGYEPGIGPARSIYWYWLRSIDASDMAIAIAAAWLALACSGRWRWGRDGYDLLGLLFGAAWIVWSFVRAWI